MHMKEVHAQLAGGGESKPVTHTCTNCPYPPTSLLLLASFLLVSYPSDGHFRCFKLQGMCLTVSKLQLL